MGFELAYWKVPRFLKDPLTVDQIREVVLDNYLYLKTLFLELIACSKYPAITQ